MTKRLILLTALISIALVGCNNDKETSSTAENSIESSVPVETTTTEPTVESKATPEPTVESTSTIEPTLSTNNSTTSGSSMTEMTAPEIQSEDFIVEDMDPTTMYMKNDYMAKEGPNESDFEDSCYLWKDEAVSVIGVVNSYKGENCTWYRLNTGEFISSEYLTTKKPTNASEVVGGNKTPQTQGTQSQTQGESPLSDMTDQEIQDALNAALSGNPSNTGSTTPDGRPFYENVHDDSDIHYNGGTEPW